MPPRQGTSGRLLWIKEDTWDTDPGSPVKRLVPMSAQELFRADQPRTAATIYDGTRNSKGSWKGMISATGNIAVSLDFRFLGTVLDCMMGHSVYTRTGSLHRWVGAGTPISFQLQKEHQDSPTIYHRHKGVYASTFTVTSAASGQATYTVGTIGKGDEVRPGTDVGGTVTDDGPFVASNYFDGSLLQDGTALSGADAFSFLIDNVMTGKDAYFLAGQRAAINIGVQKISGTLGKIFTTEDGDAFYDAAHNDTVTRLEFFYANKPLAGAPTMWCRVVIPAVLFAQTEPGVGGELIEDQNQAWIAQIPTADNPASVTGTAVTATTFTVPAASHAFVKIDGGSVIDVDLSAIAGAKTPTQIVTAMNADGVFGPVATAFVFAGHVGVKSKSTVAATSKVQFQTGTGNINTLLGYDTTIHSGDLASMIYIELQNDLAVDY